MQSTRANFEATVSPHFDELYGAAVRLTRSPADADDVLQEAMTRAWAFWDRFQEGTNARAWMHRILFNTFINGYRRKKREREILGQVKRESIEEPYWAQRDLHVRGDEVGDEVKAALDELPPVFRQVVEIVDLGGASYKEAATQLGCPVGTIMSRLHRGRKLLKDTLRDYAAAEGYVTPRFAEAA